MTIAYITKIYRQTIIQVNIFIYLYKQFLSLSGYLDNATPKKLDDVTIINYYIIILNKIKS